MSNRRDRRRLFRAKAASVVEAYPMFEELPQELILLADSFRFPRWAVESLPRLFVIVGELQDDEALVLLWRPMALYLSTRTREEYVESRTLCSGLIVEIVLTGAYLRILEKDVVPVFERLRTRLPYPGDGASDNVVDEAFHTLEIADERAGRMVEAKGLRRLRRSIALRRAWPLGNDERPVNALSGGSA